MNYTGTTIEQQVFMPTNGIKENLRNRILTIGYQWVFIKSDLKKRNSIYRKQLNIFNLKK